jgi:hypothetical protein
MTFTDIIRNAIDRNYSMEHAATDLGALMLELELIRRKYDIESPRLRELEQIIPFQEKLVLGKLRGYELFNRLDLLGIRVEKA